jgi:hypothetical protein
VANNQSSSSLVTISRGLILKYIKNHQTILVMVSLLLRLALSPHVLAQGPVIDSCPIFPGDNIWNTPIDSLPVDPNSGAYINTIGATGHPHADFGSGTWLGAPIGIPYVVAPAGQALVPINIFPYASESDPGPYPVPSSASIEGGSGSSGDRHVLVLRQGECKLYEMYRAFPNAGGGWNAESGAIFDLNSNALRPAGWTSADAAGLPILAGLVRYEEVEAGEIKHAVRFTAPQTRRAYVWPARHFASDSTNPNRPPMGQYFRLKASFVVDDSFSPQGRVILRALKKYGMILADNGSPWFISGAPDENWDNDALADDFARVSGSDFEAVDVSSLMIDPDSAQAHGFTLKTVPAMQVIEPGGVTAYQVTVTTGGNFSAPVTLTTDNPSPDLLLALAPSTLTPPGNATLTLTDTHPAGPLLPGLWYNIPLVATGGGFTRTATLTLLVGGDRVYLPVILK